MNSDTRGPLEELLARNATLQDFKPPSSYEQLSKAEREFAEVVAPQHFDTVCDTWQTPYCRRRAIYDKLEQHPSAPEYRASLWPEWPKPAAALGTTTQSLPVVPNHSAESQIINPLPQQTTGYHADNASHLVSHQEQSGLPRLVPVLETQFAYFGHTQYGTQQPQIHSAYRSLDPQQPIQRTSLNRNQHTDQNAVNDNGLPRSHTAEVNALSPANDALHVTATSQYADIFPSPQELESQLPNGSSTHFNTSMNMNGGWLDGSGMNPNGFIQPFQSSAGVTGTADEEAHAGSESEEG